MAKRSVSIRELQQNLKQVLARVERGETIDVTRRRLPVARLTPARPARSRAEWPDLEARTRSVFGGRRLRIAGSDLVVAARGER